jgi:DNA polymerase III alpha subunit
MAFIKIENKNGREQEIVIFPKVYETCGGKILVDNVIKVTGKVQARGKNGELVDPPSFMADTVETVSDEELDNYKFTGTTLNNPTRVPLTPREKYANKNRAEKISLSDPPRSEPISPEVPKTLYILLKHPDNEKVLTEIKDLCLLHRGRESVILVLDGTPRKALRLPFKVDIKEIEQPLSALISPECLKLR